MWGYGNENHINTVTDNCYMRRDIFFSHGDIPGSPMGGKQGNGVYPQSEVAARYF